MSIDPAFDVPLPPPERRIYTNRTLNLRGIKAIGYDMDYTLIHYHVDVWERRAWEYARDTLASQGWPVGDLVFDAELFDRGLILDVRLGNVVKADRFGYVRAASHGTAMLPWSKLRETYRAIHVDLRDDRWVFLSTLFDISLSLLYSQLVDLLDAGALAQPMAEPMGYRDLLGHVRQALDATHVEGRLKAEIIQDPDAYVDLDPNVPRALIDQRDAGKKLLLITNSEWGYTAAMMEFAFDRFLPDGMTWRELFDVIVVRARKPSFFTDPMPVYEVVSEDGLLRPVIGGLEPGRVYHGANASTIEAYLGVGGGEILFVGDHIFSDVNVTKRTVGWRTALVLRELEEDIVAACRFEADERRLSALMDEKAEIERQLSALRLWRQRLRNGREVEGPPVSAAALQRAIDPLKARVTALDAEAGPLAAAASTLRSARWGLILRAGIDKSHMARQLERFADIYMSRVSNFLFATPNTYLRALKSSLPHDR